MKRIGFLAVVVALFVVGEASACKRHRAGKCSSAAVVAAPASSCKACGTVTTPVRKVGGGCIGNSCKAENTILLPNGQVGVIVVEEDDSKIITLDK